MADLIERYLVELRQELRVSSPFRERILMEIEDHLREGAEREEERGALLEEAQRTVIERFGPPGAVARWWTEVYATEKGGKGMWQRFTERARRVVFYSQEEATRFGTHMVGTEHLLLGLVREPDSFAGRMLTERLQISLASVRGETEKQLSGRIRKGTGKECQLTPQAKRMIDLSGEEAQRLSNNYIGTEHLLLGLIREEEGIGGRVLRQLGLELESTRAAVQAEQEAESEEALVRRVKAQFLQAVQRSSELSPETLALANVLTTDEPK